MDVDLMKSSTEDHHMDMMTMMMMQMEKLPEFCEPDFQNSSTLPAAQIHFSNAGGTPSSSILPTPSISPLMNLPSTLSLIGNNPVQEPTTPALQPNNMAASSNKFKYPSPFNDANPYPSSVDKRNSMAAMREMIFRIAAMQPIHIDAESIKPPKRRNVKISKDPQSVAARHRRERISERIRILQRLVPGGTKMDTASMLDEAIHYVKFLKRQVQSLEQAAVNRPTGTVGFTSAAAAMANVGYSHFVKACLPSQSASSCGRNIQMLR